MNVSLLFKKLSRPNQGKYKEKTLWYILVKLLKAKDKEEIIKITGEREV